MKPGVNPGIQPVSTGPIRHNRYRGLEVRQVDGALDRAEFSLADDRHHLFLLRAGSAVVVDEHGERGLTPPAIAWLPGASARAVRQSAGSSAVLTSIPQAVLTHCLSDEATGAQILQVKQQEALLKTLPAIAFDSILNHVQLLERELYDNGPGAPIVLQRTVAIIMVLLWRQGDAQRTGGAPVPRNLVNTFFALLDVHLQDHWSVADYARHMGVSRDKLTTTLLRATGKRPLQLIHSRMIEQARLLLTTSDHQVAQVAFKLGFDDPAYFNRFFSRTVGVTPARFRRQLVQANISEDRPLSAWP